MLALTPVDSAETLPRATSAALLSPGLQLTHPNLDGVPFVPLPLLSVQFVRGLAAPADLRLRYDTVALFTHRIGAELRVRLARGRAWSFAVGVEPNTQQFVLPYQGTYIGGDVSTQFTALVTRRWASVALTFDVNATVQWMVFGQSIGREMFDPRPHLAYLDVGARLEWARGPGRTMLLGVDLCVPLDRDDPLGLAGLLPRVTLGWTWSLTPGR